MILSDDTISAYIQSGLIEVTPEIDPEQIQPASLDLRLGDKFIMYPRADVEEKDEIRIRPGACILAETKERLTIPNDLAVQVTGRSTLGRMFITVHQTAGWLDPGWDGEITLEMANLSRTSRTIKAGDRVAQAVFFPLDKPSDGYDGQYEGDGPELPGKL